MFHVEKMRILFVWVREVIVSQVIIWINIGRYRGCAWHDAFILYPLYVSTECLYIILIRNMITLCWREKKKAMNFASSATRLIIRGLSLYFVISTLVAFFMVSGKCYCSPKVFLMLIVCCTTRRKLDNLLFEAPRRPEFHYFIIISPILA